MTPHHYFNKSMESALDLFRNYDNPQPTRWAKSIYKHAVCWHLDQTAMEMVWNTNLDDDVFKDGFRLPHRIMSIEFDFIREALLEGELEPLPATDDPAKARCIICTQNPTNLDVTVNTSYFSETLKQWFLVPYAFLIPQDRFAHISTWLKRNAENGKWSVLLDNSDNGGIALTNMAPGIDIEHVLTTYNMTPIDIVQELPMIDELAIVIKLMQILSCANAPVQRVPAPAKLNKKRAKKGKRPFPEYLTLHLERPSVSYATTGSGSHASPRPHWRRGHFHRFKLRDGGYVRHWLKPILVNTSSGSAPAKPLDAIVKR
jgi:hypothetical protein